MATAQEKPVRIQALPPQEWQTRPFYTYGTPPRVEAALLARLVPLRRIPALLWHKLRYRFAWSRFEPAVVYNRIVVFDRPESNYGGMVYAPDLPAVLLRAGVARCRSACEFGAGPGYIGFSLLANGFCERVAFVDVDPASAELIRHTARFNGIEHLVKSYCSDVFTAVPQEERWDLVVCNPPRIVQPLSAADPKAHDPERELHRRFYATVKPFLSPGGAWVVFIENAAPENAAVFGEMIAAGGGRLVAIQAKSDLAGREEAQEYVISRW